jgi:hypothetical protein
MNVCGNIKAQYLDYKTFGDCEDPDATTATLAADLKHYAASKEKAAWTKMTEHTACCEKRTTCALSFSSGCPTGFELIAAKDTTYCDNNVCTGAKCCTVQATQNTCSKQKAIRTTEATGKSKVVCSLGREYDSTKAATALATSGANFDSTCCKYSATCIGEKNRLASLTGVSQKDWKCRTNFYDAEAAAASDYTDEDGNKFVIKADAAISLTTITTEKKWHDQCCVEKMKCSEFMCDAKKGRISDHTKDGQRFVNEATTQTDEGDKTCCKDDPNVCRGYTDPAADANNHHKEMGCFPSDRFFKDAGEVQLYDADGKKLREATGRLAMAIRPKTINPVGNDEDFKDQCCTARMRCEVWKDPSLAEAQASAAKHQRTVAIAPLLVAFGAITLSK